MEKLQNFLIPHVHFTVNDGATSHTARISMNIVSAASYFPPMPWPCNFFLWKYLKTKVFLIDPPRTIKALKEWIPNEVAAIPLAMLTDAMRIFRSQLEECMRLNGHHLSEVMFKKHIFFFISHKGKWLIMYFLPLNN